MLLNFALGELEDVKNIPHLKKTVFLQKSYTSLQNIEIDQIFTLIEVEIEGTFQGTPLLAEKTKYSRFNRPLKVE